MSEELRKAAQAVVDSAEIGNAAILGPLLIALKAALAASQPEPAPDRADMLKTIGEQQDEIKALREREEAHAEAKRAPMTRYQADALLCKAIQEECHGHLNWSAACSAIMAASNGLTEEQCRALVPPELTYEDSVDGLSYSDGHSDGLKDGHNACCHDMHETITAAFKETKNGAR